MKHLRIATRHALATGLLCLAFGAHAAPEEIVVFDDEFEAPGEVGTELHVNYVNRSRRQPDYPGEQAPNRVLRLMPEVAIGLSEHWNLGIHVPLSYDRNQSSSHIDGLKVRLTNLHVHPLAAERSWFWGVNYELSWLSRRLSDTGLVAELRGIVGWRSPDWLIAVNPILNHPASRSHDPDPLSLDLFSKVMRTWHTGWALGVEHYAELGAARRPTFGTGSAQTSYVVGDIEGPAGWGIHLGVGRGWRGGDDRVVFKAMIGIPIP